MRESIALLRRQPAVFLIEVGWRWTFGLLALLILARGTLYYFESLVITEADKAALSSRIPESIAEAGVRIVQGSGSMLVSVAVIMALSMGATWVVLASVGRAATLRALVGVSTLNARSLAGSSILRATLALVGALGIVAAAMVAGFIAGRDAEPQPGTFLAVFLLLAVVVTAGYALLNWYLSIAPAFAALREHRTFGAVAEAFRAVHRYRAEFTNVSAAFGGLRLGVIVVFTVLSLIPLSMVGQVPGWLVGALLLLLALAYFAISDFLYLARLAAYIAIIRADVVQESGAAAANANA